MTAGTDADPTGDAPTETESADDNADADDESAHLDSLSDGAGCTEIWEHLSETREE